MSDSARRLTPRLLPFTLSALMILIDQVTKYLVVQSIPLNSIGRVFGRGELLRFIYVQNRAVAFSLGHGLPDQIRMVLFIALPVIIIIAVIIYVIRSEEFSNYQRWVIALVVGGGIGNLIDRIFRSGGVVDFIDVKFFGIFGLERWPTFNIADSCIVVGGILLILSLLTAAWREHE